MLHAVGDGRAHVRGRVRRGGVAANGARAAVARFGRRGPRPLPRAHRHGRREPDPPRLHRQGRRRQTRRGGVRRQAGLLVEQRLRGEDVLRQRLRHVRRRGALFGQGFSVVATKLSGCAAGNRAVPARITPPGSTSMSPSTPTGRSSRRRRRHSGRSSPRRESESSTRPTLGEESCTPPAGCESRAPRRQRGCCQGACVYVVGYGCSRPI